MTERNPLPTDARRIAANPHLNQHRPEIFLLAWAALRSARGAPMRQSRFPPARNLPRANRAAA